MMHSYFEIRTRYTFRGHLPLQPGEFKFISSIVPTNGRKGRTKIKVLHLAHLCLGERALKGAKRPALNLSDAAWHEITEALLSQLDPQIGLTKRDRLYTIHSHGQSKTQTLGIFIANGLTLRCFVKVRSIDDGSANLHPAIHEPSKPYTNLTYPQLLSIKETKSFRLHVFTPVELINQKPAKLEVEELNLTLREVEEVLHFAGRDQSLPLHWRPRHCDLTPWNLKRARDGSLALLDWETAQFAPPATDLVRFATTASGRDILSLARRSYEPAELHEAVGFLRKIHQWNGQSSTWSERRRKQIRKRENELLVGI